MTGAESQVRRYEAPIPGAVAEALFLRSWVPEAPRGAVVLVHGFAEHSGRYEHVGRWLAGRGFAAYAYDHLGHGRSSGARCLVRRFDDYLDDLERVLERVHGEAPDLPRFLVGHSMGGLVVARMLCERRPPVTGAALSGPALGFSSGVPRSRLWLARLLRWLAPGFRVPAGLDLDGLCSDPKVVEDYLADPLVEEKGTMALAAELTKAIGDIGGRGAEVGCPLLVLHGTDDTLCPPQASQSFAAAAPDGRFQGYPGLRHEIFNEPTREKVLADLTDWLEAQLPSQAETHP